MACVDHIKTANYLRRHRHSCARLSPGRPVTSAHFLFSSAPSMNSGTGYVLVVLSSSSLPFSSTYFSLGKDVVDDDEDGTRSTNASIKTFQQFFFLFLSNSGYCRLDVSESVETKRRPCHGLVAMLYAFWPVREGILRRDAAGLCHSKCYRTSMRATRDDGMNRQNLYIAAPLPVLCTTRHVLNAFLFFFFFLLSSDSFHSARPRHH